MEKNRAGEPIGNLKIAQDVIATIAAAAAKEINGVAAMAQTPSKLKNLILKGSVSARSVSITMNDEIAVIDIYVILRYGAKIPEVSQNIQISVKEAVQTMTGIVVSRVNVYVSGINFEEK